MLTDIKGRIRFENVTYGPNPEMFAETLVELGVAPTVICESAGTQTDDALTMKRMYEAALNG